MRVLSRFGAMAAIAVLMTVVFAAPMSAGDETKDWTVLVYMDGDNSLESFAVINTEQLELVGSDANVNFVVLIDTMTGPADLLYIENGQSVAVGEKYGYPKEVNMADPAVLEQFIEIGVQDFPAEKYAVILWDHGGGWRGICWDDTTLELTGVDDCITMTEMRDAFAGAYKETGEVIDMVGFDACLMAMPEVSYQLRDYASFLVFSEETIPGLGFPYDMLAADLVADPTVGRRGVRGDHRRGLLRILPSISGYRRCDDQRVRHGVHGRAHGGRGLPRRRAARIPEHLCQRVPERPDPGGQVLLPVQRRPDRLRREPHRGHEHRGRGDQGRGPGCRDRGWTTASSRRTTA